jgi:hypothetical protein
MRFFFVLAVSALMGATLLAANTRHGRDLLHPLYDLDLVDDINGFELYTRVDLPIPIGDTGGAGSSAAPLMNMSLTWPAKPPQLKHHPSPTP